MGSATLTGGGIRRGKKWSGRDDGAGEVGQVVVGASLNNPRYLATASVPCRILHGAGRALARSGAYFLPNRARRARRMDWRGCGGPSAVRRGLPLPFFPLFGFLGSHVGTPRGPWGTIGLAASGMAEKRGGVGDTCGQGRRAAALASPSPQAGRSPEHARACCSLVSAPGGARWTYGGGRTGTARRGCAHDATVPHAARAACAPGPLLRQRNSGQNHSACSLLHARGCCARGAQRGASAEIVALARKGNKTNGVWSVGGLGPLATASVGGGQGPTAQRIAWVPRLEGDRTLAVSIQSMFFGATRVTGACTFCKKKCCLAGWASIALAAGSLSPRLPHDLGSFSGRACSRKSTRSCCDRARSFVPERVPWGARVQNPMTGLPASGRSAADSPSRHRHRCTRRCGQSSCKRLSSARSPAHHRPRG